MTANLPKKYETNFFRKLTKMKICKKRLEPDDNCRLDKTISIQTKNSNSNIYLPRKFRM